MSNGPSQAVVRGLRETSPVAGKTGFPWVKEGLSITPVSAKSPGRGVEGGRLQLSLGPVGVLRNWEQTVPYDSSFWDACGLSLR